MAVASNAKLSYQRLKHETWFDKDEDDYNLWEIEKLQIQKIPHQERLRLKIPNLKRYLRRKTRLVKIAFNKVYKRLKESQSHFGDIFAGNSLHACCSNSIEVC